MEGRRKGIGGILTNRGIALTDSSGKKDTLSAGHAYNEV
jgi:hypothetical protein